jgi:DNA-directed RNA polymerase subunit RPC12/RpoP
MADATPLIRTLDQELGALARGASLECLVCGEFVLRWGGEIRCQECGSRLADVTVSAARRVATSTGS